MLCALGRTSGGVRASVRRPCGIPSASNARCPQDLGHRMVSNMGGRNTDNVPEAYNGGAVFTETLDSVAPPHG